MAQIDQNEMDTISFLLDLVSYLREDKEALNYADDILDNLEGVMDDLDYLRENHQETPPHGGEGVQEVFLEIITLLETAIEDMADYLEDGEEYHLKESLSRIKDADLMIEDLRTAIAQFRLEFAEIISKINSGEIKEGEPITDRSESSINVTDIDKNQLKSNLRPQVSFSETGGRHKEDNNKKDMKFKAPKTTLLKDLQYYKDKYGMQDNNSM